jgi:hypothetical protein
LIRFFLTLTCLFFSSNITVAAAQSWEPIYTKDGISVAKKVLPDSNLMPFKGEGDVDVAIGRLVSVIKKTELGPEWVDLQVVSTVLDSKGDEFALLYQKYDLSWPVSDRDYVLRQTTTYDADKKVVTVTYESTTDPKRPVDDCCVRAVAVRTFWRFTALSPTKTHVEVEVFTDPKGALPAWLVNMIQRGWPYNSIIGLANRAGKSDISKHPRCADW